MSNRIKETTAVIELIAFLARRLEHRAEERNRPDGVLILRDERVGTTGTVA